MKRRYMGPLVSVLLAVMLSGCGDDSPPPVDEPTSASPTASDSAASEEPSETVATGTSFTVGPLTFVAPEGFKKTLRTSELLTLSGPDNRQFAVSATTSYSETTLDELASNPSVSYGSNKPKRLPDTEVGGVTVYHLAGPGSFGFTDEYGADSSGYVVQLTFQDLLGSKAEREEWIASVLASFEWQ